MRFTSTILFSFALAAGAGGLHAQEPAATLLQQFQHTEDNWSVALVNKDQFTLDNLLAPTFIDIAADAQIRTRNQLIADALSSVPQPLLSMQQRVVDVRVAGDTAVVEGTYQLAWRESSDHTRDERGVYTHVYERLHNTWTCINAQRTAVASEAEDGKKKNVSARKKSGAELPFHLPLLSRNSENTAPVPPTTSNPQ